MNVELFIMEKSDLIWQTHPTASTTWLFLDRQELETEEVELDLLD